MDQSLDAVLLMALGGPGSMAEVRPFIHSVLGGRPVPADRIEEVVRHYEAVGGRSPLTELTMQQARALERRLARDGRPMPVLVGMRCWSPWLADTVREIARRGFRRVAAVVLSPYRDRYTSSQYDRSLSAACEALHGQAPELIPVPPWHDHPLYVQALADRIKDAVESAGIVDPRTTPLVFSTHSLPLGGPGIDEHVARIRSTCAQVVQELSWKHWSIAYQSRAGPPDEPWLEPDICTVIAELADRGHRGVLIACPGFVCDHVEVLYDLDVEAARVAEQRGMVFARAGTVGAHASFIRMLSELICGLPASG
ncbi:MAG: ferrochelatase [Phycisphaerales bacterium]|nr:MAG: ferrochelatase [Phycisphaerales bacterium]